jgi:hypothetical protein
MNVFKKGEMSVEIKVYNKLPDTILEVLNMRPSKRLP